MIILEHYTRLSPKEKGKEENKKKSCTLVVPHLMLWVATLCESCMLLWSQKKTALDKFCRKETLNVRLSVHGGSKKQYLAHSCPLVNVISILPLVLCGVIVNLDLLQDLTTKNNVKKKEKTNKDG